ncbi:MAG: glycerophosphodiester phosphodiesterase [Flavobacteriales bacterium]|nr:glycerophosphodiester phosphodiesterase [Flavobacteriales bacterium]
MKNYLLVGLFATTLWSCGDKQNTANSGEVVELEEEKSINVNFDLQGHRGARGLFPENSIEGFLAAVELQVNTVEMDVVVTKDGKVVVSHEPWVSSVICWGLEDKPVPEGKGLVIYQMTYDQLTNYNCGSQVHPDFPLQAKMATFKPLLSDVITEVEANASALELEPLKYSIEIKSTPEGDGVFHPAPKEFCELVLNVIKQGNIKDRAIIQSFDVRALQAMKQLEPSIPVALLISETDGFEKDLEKLGFTPEIYSPNFHLVNEQLVNSCKQNGIKLIPWTVNEEEDMVELLEMGVDGLITDYPDVALTLKM